MNAGLLLEEMYGQGWAVSEDQFSAMEQALLKLSTGQPPADLRTPFSDRESELRGYEVIHGVAVLPLHGVLTKRESYFTRYYGGTSADAFRHSLQKALDDSAVARVAIDVESPGGTVAGTSLAATAVYDARGRKPIIAIANELMGSGAVWIGTAADEVWTVETATIGSVGAIVARRDLSKMLNDVGAKTHIFKSGVLKDAGRKDVPLSEAESQHLQEYVNSLFTLFVAGVARNRGMSEADVIERVGDARLMVGREAIEAGLADRVGTLEELIGEQAGSNSAGGGVTYASTSAAVSTATAVKPTTATVPRVTQETPAPVLSQHPSEVEIAQFKATATLRWNGDAELRQEFGGDFKCFYADYRHNASAYHDSTATAPNPAAAGVPSAAAQTPAPVLSKNPSDHEIASFEQAAKSLWNNDARVRQEFGGDFKCFYADYQRNAAEYHEQE